MNTKHKPVLLILPLFTLILILSGCTLPPPPVTDGGAVPMANSELAAQLEESRTAWIAERDANNGSYTYATSFQSWTGYRSRTTVVVQNNEVVERTFSASYPNEQGGMVEESWQEIGPEEVGTNGEGASAKTLDELYAQCATEVLSQSPSMNDIFLELGSDGILRRCTYFPNNCADDCEMGVRIESITFPAAQD